MQTVRYYRDYAERARRLKDSVDRRSIMETLQTLAQGFEELANALETGQIMVLPAESARTGSGSNGSRVTDRAAHFLSTTRH